MPANGLRGRLGAGRRVTLAASSRALSRPCATAGRAELERPAARRAADGPIRGCRRGRPAGCRCRCGGLVRAPEPELVFARARRGAAPLRAAPWSPERRSRRARDGVLAGRVGDLRGRGRRARLGSLRASAWWRWSASWRSRRAPSGPRPHPRASERTPLQPAARRRRPRSGRRPPRSRSVPRRPT